jgi:hypothetical protein
MWRRGLLPPPLAGFVKIFAKAAVQFYRARICKRLRSPGINSKKSIPPAYPVEDCFTLFYTQLY